MKTDARGFLSSRRLSFHTWRRQWLPWAQQLYSCAQTTRFLGGPLSAVAIADRLDYEMHCQDQWQVQYWPMILRSSRNFVGCCGLHPFQPERGAYELGYHLLPAFWNQGLATEAAVAVVNYGFKTLNVRSILAGHHPANHLSQRILEKLGFEYTHDALYEPTGLQHPVYLLLPSDWKHSMTEQRQMDEENTDKCSREEC